MRSTPAGKVVLALGVEHCWGLYSGLGWQYKTKIEKSNTDHFSTCNTKVWMALDLEKFIKL
jgi:hypothetical protein